MRTALVRDLRTLPGPPPGLLGSEQKPSSMKWAVAIMLSLSCCLSAEPEASLAGLRLGMNATQLEQTLGPSDARQPKLEPGLQVWSYHEPTNLSLVVRDGRLSSVSASGEGCAKLLWKGQHLCVLGVTKTQVKDSLGNPSRRQNQSWIYRDESDVWLKVYFENEVVQAVLLAVGQTES